MTLPDTRIMTVEYYADETGYHPTITFEGEAQVFAFSRQETHAEAAGNVQQITDFQDFGDEASFQGGVNEGLQTNTQFETIQENQIQSGGNNFQATQGQFIGFQGTQDLSREFDEPQAQITNNQAFDISLGQIDGFQGSEEDLSFFQGSQGPINNDFQNISQRVQTTASRQVTPFAQVQQTPSFVATETGAITFTGTPSVTGGFGTRTQQQPTGVPLPLITTQNNNGGQSFGQQQTQQIFGNSVEPQPQSFGLQQSFDNSIEPQLNLQTQQQEVGVPLRQSQRGVVSSLQQNGAVQAGQRLSSGFQPSKLTIQSQQLSGVNTQQNNGQTIVQQQVRGPQQQSNFQSRQQVSQNSVTQLPSQLYQPPNIVSSLPAVSYQNQTPRRQQGSSRVGANQQQQSGQAAATIFQNNRAGQSNRQQNVGHSNGQQNAGQSIGQQNAGQSIGQQNAGQSIGQQNAGQSIGQQNAGQSIGQQNAGQSIGQQNAGHSNGQQTAGQNFQQITSQNNNRLTSNQRLQTQPQGQAPVSQGTTIQASSSANVRLQGGNTGAPPALLSQLYQTPQS